MKRLINILVLSFLALMIATPAFSQEAATPTPVKKSRKQIKKEKELNEELCEIADDFNKMIVWKAFDKGSLVVLPEKKLLFLNEAEKVRDKISIENYQIALCQILDNPPVRKQKPREPVPGMEDIMTTPSPTPPKEIAGRDMSPQAIKKAAKKKNKPEVYYGLVLVRFNNQTTMPSVKVVTRLVKEYWIYNVKLKVWYIDSDLSDLFEE